MQVVDVPEQEPVHCWLQQKVIAIQHIGKERSK